MEVKVIKTCEGLKELRFLDGALVPHDVSLNEAESADLVEWMTVREWMRRFAPSAAPPLYGNALTE